MCVRWSFASRRCNQHSPTHAQMNHHFFATVERTQQLFSSAIRCNNRCARQSINQCFATSAAHGSFASNFNARNASANNMTFNAASNGFHFGKFWHTLRRNYDAGSSLFNTSHAISAAICSAAFFDLPSPYPSSRSPTNTVAKNIFSWSGPSSSTL